MARTKRWLTLVMAFVLALNDAKAAEERKGFQHRGSNRRQLLPGIEGAGRWEQGGDTGAIFIHASVLNDGQVVGWGFLDTMEPSSLWNPASKGHESLLGRKGIHGGENAFCSGQVTTHDGEVLIFGGHDDDNPDEMRWFRRYNHASRSLEMDRMSSPRWYPTPTTLPDGRVIVVGGVPDPGDAGYDGITRHPWSNPALDNPTYEVYDPWSRKFSGDKWDMSDQLGQAHPINTYPFVVVTPDGNLAVSAGRLLWKYNWVEANKWVKAFEFQPRPGAPWSYPQTGAGTPLPMFPPWTRLEFLAAGGTSKDWAGEDTAASDKAEVVDLSGGPGTGWRSVGRMPRRRVMGDALILCDGTVGVFNGAEQGIAGWSTESKNMKFKDGGSWWCDNERCSSASKPVYEPAIFDPATGQWSARGSLAEMRRPRLYHSTAVLLPDCRVMVAGSDVTWDTTAEVYTPPYLGRGPRPLITALAPAVRPGVNLTVQYRSQDPVLKAILIRTTSITHSVPFDARALWLPITSFTAGGLVVATPPTSSQMPPGLYMLVLLSSRGVPSVGKIISVQSQWMR